MHAHPTTVWVLCQLLLDRVACGYGRGSRLPMLEREDLLRSCDLQRSLDLRAASSISILDQYVGLLET